ncbi:MAG TPA: histidine kinase N-terminal 7TM domain-containing protein [Anaerolineales bacterium]|nr:histidine kinase N-terminal 7TM domain-containing protein [Anaerolineales bacterium]
MNTTAFYIGYIVILLASSVVGLLSLLSIWRYRSAPGAYSLLLAVFSGITWSFAYVLEISAPDLATKLLWAKMEYLGIAFVTPGIFLFAMHYSGRGAWLTPARVWSILGMAGSGFVAALTNEWHDLIWTEIRLTNGNAFGPLALTHGSAFYFFVALQYIFILASTLIIMQITIRGQIIYRYQSRIMLAGMFFPWVANIIYVISWTPISQLDLTPLAFSLTNLALSISFLRYRMMDLRPIAHSSVFNAMQDGVIVLDYKERIVEANPVATFVFQDQGNFIGREITSLLPTWKEWQSKNSKGELQYPLILNLGGEKLTFNLRTTSIFDDQGKRYGRVLLISDVTTQKRAEEELLSASRMKSQLLANLGHDLRSPLGAIVGYAEMLKDGSFGAMSLNQEKASAEILDAANQLLSFINNIVGQAQMETGKVILREYPFDVDEVIGPLLSTLNYHATKKGITLVEYIDPALPKRLLGDQFWLRQIVMNLVHNAVKFTKEGSVSVRFIKYGEENWAIQVIDSGIGISPEAQKRVFDAFEQVNSIENSDQNGFGLGLSIVAKLTSIMHGKIELKSEANKGSTFTVIIPLKEIGEEKISK